MKTTTSDILWRIFITTVTGTGCLPGGLERWAATYTDPAAAWAACEEPGWMLWWAAGCGDLRIDTVIAVIRAASAHHPTGQGERDRVIDAIRDGAPDLIYQLQSLFEERDDPRGRMYYQALLYAARTGPDFNHDRARAVAAAWSIGSWSKRARTGTTVCDVIRSCIPLPPGDR